MTDEQLVKVVFLGSADPREQNGKILLADGEDGQPRSLTLGGDPSDCLVTVEELHQLTGTYQIEVIEDSTSEPAPPAPGGSGASSVPTSSPASPPEPVSPTAPSAS